MATLKHTPGPWTAIAKRDPDPSEGTHWIRCAFGALGYWRGHKQYHEDCNWVLNEADAHLVAAAPEMLQLLRDAWDAYMCDPNPQALTATMNKVEELLARLDGNE